jgi:hypothetical protein
VFCCLVVLRRQNTATCGKQHVTDPRPLHHIQLHRPGHLMDVARDFLHRLDDFRMVGLAG